MIPRREYATIQLAAVAHARRALRDLGFEQEPWIDPFLAIERAGALLLFTPLVSLWGAFMPRLPDGDMAGIMVSTNLPLSVQRFTAAHELGHLRMKHAPSLDTEENIVPRGAVARGQRARVGDERQEVAAEAFAAHFLMPKGSVLARMHALGVARGDLRDADVVYALSLWFGVSYSAMVWHLVSLKLLGRWDATELARTRPKSLKQAVAGSDVFEKWHNDVWPLSAEQSGEVVHARVGDALAITLPSHASGGYLWEAGAVDPEGLELVRLEPAAESATVARLAGASLPHQALVRVKRDGHYSLELVETLPWEPDERAAEFRLTVVAQGVFARGIAPLRRRAHLTLVPG